jgi:hypothetical protein
MAQQQQKKPCSNGEMNREPTTEMGRHAVVLRDEKNEFR